MTYRIGDNADLITLSGEGQPRPEPFPDPPPPAPTAGRQARGVLCALLIMIGFGGTLFSSLLLLFGLYSMGHTFVSLQSYPRADATIKACEIYSKLIDTSTPEGATHRSIVYGFRCNVSYSPAAVQGASTPGSETEAVADIGYQHSDHADLTRWSERYYAGMHTQIVYKPSDPTHVHLAGDFTTAYAAPLGLLRFTIQILLVCGLAFYAGRKLRRSLNPERSGS
jgi:hypothetical protein